MTNLLGKNFAYYTEMQLLGDSIRNEQDAILHQLAASAEEMGIAVYTSVSHERPEADMIVAKAEACGAKFVVKGSQHHSPSERASFVHTDWQLIRKLECPLWFVKPTQWKDSPVIVAAVDPTHDDDKEAVFDRKIIKRAQDITEKCNGKLMLFHTYQRLEEIGSHVTWKFKPERLPVDELDEKIREEHRNAIESLAAACDVSVEVIHQLPGRTHELLPTFARANGVSLVVMGAIARSGLKQRIVGSTAARVLDLLPCDVLVVHD